MITRLKTALLGAIARWRKPRPGYWQPAVVVKPRYGPEPGEPHVLLRAHSRILWTMQEAVLCWLYLPPQNGTGRRTCAEIAMGHSASNAVFGLGGVTAAQVNSAMSSMSIRTKRKWTTDIAPEASPHTRPEEGLQTPWRNRLWQLTPNGMARAKMLLDVRHSKLLHTSEARARREASA